MTLDHWAWILIAAAVADWGATVALVRGANRLHEAALNERATASVILTVVASGAALLSAFYLLRVVLPPDWWSGALVALFLLVSVPQLVWYVAYRSGRFR